MYYYTQEVRTCTIIPKKYVHVLLNPRSMYMYYYTQEVRTCTIKPKKYVHVLLKLIRYGHLSNIEMFVNLDILSFGEPMRKFQFNSIIYFQLYNTIHILYYIIKI